MSDPNGIRDDQNAGTPTAPAATAHSAPAACRNAVAAVACKDGS